MNKRHYEHTLPNIRGSLSNTYQKRGTENLIRGKSVAPDLNIYAKHAPNPAYIPYIIHSVSAKRKINRKRTVLRSAHNESKSYANHTINRWKRK